MRLTAFLAIVSLMSHAPSPEFVALQRVVAGRYSLHRELGRGGMGVVFLARDVALDRLIAVKLLPPELAAEPALRQRFLAEARTAAGLSHPHVVSIHAVEEHGDLVFFVMGYVDGETLGQRVRRAGAMPSAELMRVVQEVAWALGHAHSRGLVHRDVKPDNVLLERDSGRALVTDFGIARVVASSDTPGAGTVIGTPQYMSPEQAEGRPVDARSDLYSLGVTAFYAATARLPFESESVAGMLAQHVQRPAPPIASLAPSLPPRFAAAIDRCLAKAPDERFASAEELAEEVRVARGTRTDLPVPVRRFARETYAVGGEAGGYLASAAAVAVVLQTFRAIQGDFLGFISMFEVLLVTVFVSLSGMRFAQLVPLARELLRHGYDHRSVRAALELEDRRRREEAEVAPKQSRVGDVLTVGAAGAVAAGGFAIMGMSDLPMLIEALGWLMAMGAPVAAVRRLVGRRGGSRLWNRLMRGRFGRWVFGVGKIGLKERPEALQPGEHTEVALGRVATELYAALPDEQRKQLGNVPALVAHLEADATALRGRVLGEKTDERLAVAVAALEGLRLNLLRLHAGAATLHELTQDVEAARRVGEEIDAALRAREEVEEIAPERTPV